MFLDAFTMFICQQMASFFKNLLGRLLFWMLIGVNFINVLLAAFAPQIPKVQKKTDNLTVFFTLLGSTCIKAVCRTLMKLTPNRQLRHNYNYHLSISLLWCILKLLQLVEQTKITTSKIPCNEEKGCRSRMWQFGSALILSFIWQWKVSTQLTICHTEFWSARNFLSCVNLHWYLMNPHNIKTKTLRNWRILPKTCTFLVTCSVW